MFQILVKGTNTIIKCKDNNVKAKQRAFALAKEDHSKEFVVTEDGVPFVAYRWCDKWEMVVCDKMGV